jgi:pyruvate dehydrogenase E1 component alpha subunit
VSELIGILDADGVRCDHPDFPLELGADELLALYRDMALVRRLDTEAIALQRQGELGLWTSLLGQEAAQVGAGRALQPHDMVFPSYREHGVAWCRGLDPIALLEIWRGSGPGGWAPHEHNFAPYVIVIGAQTLHAVGYAMGVVRDGAVGTGEPSRDTAVLTFLGDGAMSQGDTNEAFAWAAASQLPVVFFCQNNQWAISAPVTVQARVPMAQRAAGFGFPGLRVDGNDVLAALAVTRAALDSARRGEGPALIEAVTYRMNPHTTSDDARRYRADTELETWRARDPLVRLRTHLQRDWAVPDGAFAEIADESDKLAIRFRDGGRALATVPPEAVFDHAFSRLPDGLCAQRAEFAEFVGRG